ncbi:MAG: radical SAM protein [Deltaproteobacteria bacterium]|nr:radical SAM protein [Deltaproteobacteria bacterium]
MEEWSPPKRWNPFNSNKLLAQVYRWRLIKRGASLPQPVLVTVDPINACNLRCTWCNSRFVLRNRNGMIDREALMEIAEGLARWQGSPDWPAGVEAVCIAGGGEPLLHPDVGAFIESCIDNGIEVGVVTNGVNIDRFIPQLALCTWVGVSVDAGSRKTFESLKGRDLFNEVCRNMRSLSDYLSRNACTLGREGSGRGVSYKYLLYDGNIDEVFEAARIAKEVGAKNFHLRPAGTPWHLLPGRSGSVFHGDAKMRLGEQIDKARELEDETFGVYAITHKFGPELEIANNFDTCHAIFMTAVFMPPRDERRERFCVSCCCDRRGDPRLEFGESLREFKQVEELWGSEKHWQIFDRIDLKDCPRCTYAPHNQMFTQVIERDDMTYKFI